eukprot:6874069-Prymnesium_polylepis.1
MSADGANGRLGACGQGCNETGSVWGLHQFRGACGGHVITRGACEGCAIARGLVGGRGAAVAHVAVGREREVAGQLAATRASGGVARAAARRAG